MSNQKTSTNHREPTADQDVSGSLLSGSRAVAIGCGAVALVFVCGLEAASWGNWMMQRKKKASAIPRQPGSEIALTSQRERLKLFE